MTGELVSLNKASEWASDYLEKPVTPTNISYLVQYAKIRRYYDKKNRLKVNTKELKQYYDQNIKKRQEAWKEKLGNDLNWELSFDQLREADTTKHVHRLHPYKGKFIPQLVEYFLNNHLNTFKKEVFFNEGDVVLDPFMGCGTTLVQASELGLHSVGIDISDFNCLISEVKCNDYNIDQLKKTLFEALKKTTEFSTKTFDDSFDNELKEKLYHFNKKNFVDFEFKWKAAEGKINGKQYASKKLSEFLIENNEFLEKNGTKDKSKLFDEKKMSSFLSKWFSKRIRQELSYYQKLTNSVEDKKIKKVMMIILSRTARSCRVTTHSDLATLKEPQKEPYFCMKHGKICTPINSVIKHLRRNTHDTIKRLNEFAELKKSSKVAVLRGDSREIDIFEEVKKENPELYKILSEKKIDGVFTSPPYVGQIDYHEQHAYSYELFKIQRKDDLEIGPLRKGQGKKSREEYIEGISKVLRNISKFVKSDGNFFIVANDKYNLYPTIAEKSNLKIVNKFKRPVLNRTERDRQPYSEAIFHMRKNL